jgi:hypothetical protein
MSGWTFLTVVIQYEQAFCLRRLYWYVCSRIPIVWRHEGTSHATSCHSVVTSAWWYNILYSIEIFGFSHSMQPIWYKTFYQKYVWWKMYISRFYFHDIISLECEKTPMTSSLINAKCHWGIIQNNILYLGYILQENSSVKNYTSFQEYPLSQKTIQGNNSYAFRWWQRLMT